jgi:hypothetical protein
MHEQVVITIELLVEGQHKHYLAKVTPFYMVLRISVRQWFSLTLGDFVLHHTLRMGIGIKG